MAITEWKYIALIITTNKSAGAALANIATKFPHEVNAEMGMFDNAIQLTPQAWAVELICTQGLVDIIDALMEGAPLSDPRISHLTGRGLNSALWGQAKNIIKADWYRLWQDDGSYTPDLNALNNFILAQGYQVAV